MEIFSKERFLLFSKILDSIDSRINFFNKDLGSLKLNIENLFKDCSYIRKGIHSINSCKEKCRKKKEKKVE